VVNPTEEARTMQTNTLKVPGATLYYETRGDGPVLLMIPGGPTDAGVFAGIAPILAEKHTVVTYDPRGHSRSPLDGPPEDIPVSVHADDAAALIEATSDGPAVVFGSSGGATIGLDLVARRPELVTTFVAHESPVMMLLPDADRWRDTFAKIDATYRSDGVFAAMGLFGAAVEEGGPKYSEEDQGPPPDPEMMQRMMANFDLFIAHEIQQIGLYEPDIDALRSAQTRIVVGGGKESGEQAAYRSAVALAERLGIDVTYFPEAHGGFGTPEGAVIIADVLATG
jgi:pimeloyl-ACP methyl ester carboxylesterase